MLLLSLLLVLHTINNTCAQSIIHDTDTYPCHDGHAGEPGGVDECQ